MKSIFNIPLLFITTLILWAGVTSCTKSSETTISETVKLALRDVGHRLLLNNQDSTSLVKPVIDLGNSKYQLSFENQLAISPDNLVTIIKQSFEKTQLPQHYLVEVMQCQDGEVAYSYQMNENVEKGIIPCSDRALHHGCYKIQIRFNNLPKENTNSIIVIILTVLGVLSLLVFYKRRRKIRPNSEDQQYEAIGRFKFYPEQHKLIKEATEISLSNKECELLSLFIAKPNQIITRYELTKKVWEDNGVIVGRSLDTYISKLRKKMQDDTSIKLTNVHGVGYKLEVEE